MLIFYSSYKTSRHYYSGNFIHGGESSIQASGQQYSLATYRNTVAAIVQNRGLVNQKCRPMFDVGQM